MIEQSQKKRTPTKEKTPLHPRAPRYTLQVQDHPILRFKTESTGPKSLHTRLIDLSESGLAFIVPTQSCPELGEKIKMELTPPNSPPVACFGMVQRIQKHRSYDRTGELQTFRLVAVEFLNLPPAQRQQIAQGLYEQFQKQYKAYRKEQRWKRLLWFWHQIIGKRL